MNSARPRRLQSRLLGPLIARAVLVIFFLSASGHLLAAKGHFFAQCPSDSLIGDPGDDLNANINYYGGIFDDADRGGPTCAVNAAARLTRKLDDAIAAGKRFNGFLEGAHVTLIFAAALRIGGQDLMTAALDADLQYVRSQYLQFGGVNAVAADGIPCGFANGNWQIGNTCMDDYTVAADAYGWIAGYEYRAGRVGNAWTAIDLAGLATTRAFGDTSVCIFDPSKGFDPSRGPCNATVSDLGSVPGVVVVSLNHGFENIAYGIGLMPLLAGAHLGLRVANSGLSFDPSQITIAQGIIKEAQQASDPQGINFLSSCRQFPSYAQNHYCTDGMPSDCSTLPLSQYACPDMYPINLFYTNHLGGVPNPSLFPFNVKGNLFTENDLSAVMGLGRRILFQTLAYDWFVSTPSLRGKLDGYVDSVDCQYIAGWAWDSTQPTTPINVDIYDGATLLATIPANVFRSDLAGKGDGRHAFSWAVPPSLNDGQQHWIWVNFGGTGIGSNETPLGNTPRAITCTGPAYQGYLDGADCSTIEGWAWDQAQPNTPINVNITYDAGSILGTFSANLPRPDLTGIGNGYHAFSVSTPGYLKNGVSHSIAATFPDGGSLTASPQSINCQTTPSISSVFPTFGPTTGGSLVTIRGSGLQSGATIQFGGVAATGVTWIDSSTLKATTQARAAGLVDVVVTNPDGQTRTLSGGFTYGGVNSYTLTPCRVVDTRNPTGPYGGPALNAGAERTFVLAGQCGVPSTAKAVIVNVAVTGPTGPGFFTLYPGGTTLPLVSTLNYSAGQTRANNAIVYLGSPTGDLSVTCGQGSGTAHIIIDVVGYLQ